MKKELMKLKKKKVAEWRRDKDLCHYCEKNKTIKWVGMKTRSHFCSKRCLKKWLKGKEKKRNRWYPFKKLKEQIRVLKSLSKIGEWDDAEF